MSVVTCSLYLLSLVVLSHVAYCHLMSVVTWCPLSLLVCCHMLSVVTCWPLSLVVLSHVVSCHLMFIVTCCLLLHVVCCSLSLVVHCHLLSVVTCLATCCPLSPDVRCHVFYVFTYSVVTYCLLSLVRCHLLSCHMLSLVTWCLLSLVCCQTLSVVPCCLLLLVVLILGGGLHCKWCLLFGRFYASVPPLAMSAIRRVPCLWHRMVPASVSTTQFSMDGSSSLNNKQNKRSQPYVIILRTALCWGYINEIAMGMKCLIFPLAVYDQCAHHSWVG